MPDDPLADIGMGGAGQAGRPGKIEFASKQALAFAPAYLAGVFRLEHRTQLGGHTAGHEGDIGGVRHRAYSTGPRWRPLKGTKA